jgi:uncharacterized membrane-anchored protein YitT (DUF2179 family)
VGYQSVVVVGAAVAAFAFTVFQVPFRLAAGGVSGLAILTNHYTGLSEGLLVFLFNLPLMVLGFFHLGRWHFLLKTVIGVGAFTAFAEFFRIQMPHTLANWPITDDPLLAAIYAGILFGVGIGMIYRAGGSIGGSSIPARILHNYTGFPLSQTFLYVDLSVILAAGFIFRWEMALLAFLTMILGGIVSDLTLEGASQARTAMIITDKADALSQALMYELQRGVSLLPATGAYTGAPRTMIYCTVLRSQVAYLKYLVQRIDPDAHLVVGVVQQAWGGKGFKALKHESPE